MGNKPPVTNATALPRQVSTTPRRRRWLWITLLCVFVLISFGAYRGMPKTAERNSSDKKTATTQPSQAIPVIVAKSRRGDLPIYLNGLGNVAAFRTVTVRARVEGLLTKVAFVEGQMVQEGDVLAEIDKRPFQADLDSKIGAMEQASAQVDLAQITYDRLKELMPAASASPIEFKQAKATLKQAQAALDGAKAAVELAQLNMEWCRVTAPIGGRIGLRVVDKGNLVHVNDPNGVAVVAQLQPIAVIFSLPQSSLPRVLKGNSTAEKLVAEAYDGDLQTLLATGSLLAVDNQIDTSTGTARFKAIFENKDNKLFPNQFVNIRLLVDTKKDAVLVPSAAVQRSPTTTYIYVVKADDTVEMRPVTIGPTESGLTLIEKGMAGDETVVTDGVDKLQPGTKIHARRVDHAETRAG